MVDRKYTHGGTSRLQTSDLTMARKHAEKDVFGEVASPIMEEFRFYLICSWDPLKGF